jgi:Asp-tRNA(Asn)/Glu-tRNA(Gln) amidotransferase A subunit family amidase
VNEEVFRKQEVELLITPPIRRLPWTIEDELLRAANARPRTSEPGNTRALDDFGLPTITVPCGFSKVGMPAGLQISGPNLGEVNVLALGTPTRRPPTGTLAGRRSDPTRKCRRCPRQQRARRVRP